MKPDAPALPPPGSLPKCPTGIEGLDAITGGGLPRGRPSLVCGATGCGKTLLAMEFLINGATEHGEPGVFLAFEESAEDLAANVRSLGYDLPRLAEQGLLLIDHVVLDREEIAEAGEYDLDGLFIRLGHAIDSIGAKRVVVDTIEVLFASLSDEGLIRSELRRLFGWLKEKGVTSIITGERGDGTLTRHGLEEYVSDCVILLDHRVADMVSTRRLRIVKYRGSNHGTNEYLFLIDQDGFEVLPITEIGLDHPITSGRVPTGIDRLDTMLGGRGYFRGSSVLLSGSAGTGKTSVSALFLDAACRRGERCLYFGSEESPAQVVRNMQSIGLDLGRWIRDGLLQCRAARPIVSGLESHLIFIYKAIRAFTPTIVVVDPINNFLSVGSFGEVRSMLLRLIDYLKSEGITAFFTSLTHGSTPIEQTDVGVSSLIDTWMLVRDMESDGERNRALYVLKSRGMGHSNQVREFVITDRGVELVDVDTGPDGVLLGSRRRAREAARRAEAESRREEAERSRRDMERRQQVLEARIATLRLEHEIEIEAAERLVAEGQALDRRREAERLAMAAARRADPQNKHDSAPARDVPDPGEGKDAGRPRDEPSR